jgi:hypothetical protein
VAQSRRLSSSGALGSRQKLNDMGIAIGIRRSINKITVKIVITVWFKSTRSSTSMTPIK